MAFTSLVLSFFQAVSVYLLLPLFSIFFFYVSRKERDVIDYARKRDREMVLAVSTETEKEDSNKLEIPEFSLKFNFPTFEEFSRIPTGTGNNLADSQVLTSVIHKYEAVSGKSPAVRAFIHEPPHTFPVKEINLVKIGDNYGEIKNGQRGKVILGFRGAENVKYEAIIKTLSGKQEQEFPGNLDLTSDKNKSGESILLPDRDSRGKFVAECKNWKAGQKYIPEFKENQELADEFNSGFLSEKYSNDHKTMPKVHSSIPDNLNDGNKLESLWEHQELIEQLKMELRKVRDTGLPTILEESESPRILTDESLKPWKIDESLHFEDCIDEVNKFYKSYIETMRKFDIFNYQKMYAFGFLQLKDPFQRTLQQKASPTLLKSLVSKNGWLFKHKRGGSDPVSKFVGELQGDVEVVYVGQMCLSWEFLHWQYVKVLELWKSDAHGIHHYNEVAGEFQQFQVLMQRYMEDEPFQGSRVQSYVKSRCVLRNLLQVPAIRADDQKDKMNKAKRRDGAEKDEYLITSEMLVEIVEESIRMLWKFARSDKDCDSLPIKGHKKNMPQLRNPQDHKLLSEVKKTLLKKERKMRDIVRSERCILRRFQIQIRESGDDSDQVLFFFAQVDMKLVGRVLNMSKVTRDQLIWCQNKLSRISFENRKMHVEPAFLLFPAC